MLSKRFDACSSSSVVFRNSPFCSRKRQHNTTVSPVRDTVKRFFIGSAPDGLPSAAAQTKIDWQEKWGPVLEGFPLNILYGGIATDATKKLSIVDVCYWPAPATFHEDSERKGMCYFSNLANDYFVRVIFEKRTNEWQTEKYKGDTLVRSAFGPTFDKVMINTTMGGPEPDER